MAPALSTIFGRRGPAHVAGARAIWRRPANTRQTPGPRA